MFILALRDAFFQVVTDFQREAILDMGLVKFYR